MPTWVYLIVCDAPKAFHDIFIGRRDRCRDPCDSSRQGRHLRHRSGGCRISALREASVESTAVLPGSALAARTWCGWAYFAHRRICFGTALPPRDGGRPLSGTAGRFGCVRARIFLVEKTRPYPLPPDSQCSRSGSKTKEIRLSNLESFVLEWLGVILGFAVYALFLRQTRLDCIVPGGPLHWCFCAAVYGA